MSIAPTPTAGLQLGDILTYTWVPRRRWWRFWRKPKPPVLKRFEVSWTSCADETGGPFG